jgi:nucleoside-diphosphate-sugar epimerase
MGTCEEYGSSTVPFHEGLREAPVSAYSFSKATATQLLQTLYRTHRLPVVVLRPSLVYGPGQQPDMFLPALIQALLREEAFPMSAGRQTRDFVYIDDMVEAMIKASRQSDALGKAINISCGTPTILRDLALLVARIIGNDCERLIKLGEVPYRLAEIMEYVANPNLAKSILNWSPSTSLEKGLSQTIDYYRSRPTKQKPV